MSTISAGVSDSLAIPCHVRAGAYAASPAARVARAPSRGITSSPLIAK
jgi:hypothetical protein